MPLHNGQLALLAVLCGFAAQSLSPHGASVRSAVIHRPKTFQGNRFARHDIEMADYRDVNVDGDQVTFSSFWSRSSDSPSKCTNGGTKKRFVTISDPQGTKYSVNHRRETPLWLQRNGTSNSTASTSSVQGEQGTVAILNHNSNDAVGSLFCFKAQNRTCLFGASPRNATQMLMMSVSSLSSGGELVRMAFPSESGETVCATYDQDPPRPKPFTAEPCLDDGGRSGRKSQIFLYNRTSGELQPTSFLPQSVDVENAGTPIASSSSAFSSLWPSASSDSVAPTPSASSSVSPFSKRVDDGPYSAENVTLMFVPQNSSTPSAAIQEVFTSTSTVTQTVIVYSSSTSSSASGGGEFVEVTSSPASAMSSSGSAERPGVTGLSVEVVGNSPLDQLPLPISKVTAALPSGVPVLPVPTPPTPPTPNSPSASVATASSSFSSTTPSPSVAADAVNSESSVSSSFSPGPSTVRTLFERSALFKAEK